MPEGHTIHRLALDHMRDLAGDVVRVSSPQGRMADGAALVDGRVLRAVDPYGKHLFYRFAPLGSRSRSRRDGSPADDVLTVHVHLGLFGRFVPLPVPPPQPAPTVRLRLAGSRRAVDLIGPTDCRIVDRDDEAVIRARLGPDPIRDDADPELAWERLRRRRTSVGEALMDQKVMAGVGNVYRAESLFVHGIDPQRPAAHLTRHEFDALWSTIVRMLRQGVRDARIITVDDDELGVSRRVRRGIRSKEAVYVYKKDACRRCGTAIRRFDLAGRWAYACPACQPR